MTVTDLDTALSRLAPMSLDELVERAGLQTRVDRKYLVPVEEVDLLLDRLAPQAQALDIGGQRMFDYESVYFDTADLLAYHLAAGRRRRRFKVRTRTYVDSAQCWLEVKTRGPRGTTVKERLPYDLADRHDLAHGRWFVAGVLGTHGIRGTDGLAFAPTLVTRYQRTTLFLPETASRVTVDVDLSWHDGRTPLRLRGLAVVETKTGSTASGADRLLWAHGHRPQRISKYATGLAALRPDLPATRWRRTLRRHLLPACPEPITRSTSTEECR